MKVQYGTALAATALTLACAGDDITTPVNVSDAVDVSAAYAAEVVGDIQIVDLGTLPGGTNSLAADISDVGDIVGTSETSSAEDHGFFLSGPNMIDIGTLPGGDRSAATGVNDLGQVVGSARNSVGVTHGFVWQGGVISDLGAFPPEDDIGSESRASAINNSGLISGHVDLAGGVWDLNGTPNFPPFPPFVSVTEPGPFAPARANDINNMGQAAGTLLSAAQGFRWQAGVLEPLVAVGGVDDAAFGINGLGEVVGRGLLVSPVRYHAVLWPDPATVVDLGTLGGDNSAAFDINDDGLVVGSSETDTGDTVAFVWRADLGMHSLGTLGGANSHAFAINAEGTIVGESETGTGETHAALWTITIATAIDIDIKPGSDPNSVNPRSRGVIPVAILTDADFDATTVDPLSVEFGPNGTGETHGKGHIEDVDGDGTPDLVLHFRTSETGIECGDTEATLDGSTFDGQAVQGTDSINTVGCS